MTDFPEIHGFRETYWTSGYYEKFIGSFQVATSDFCTSMLRHSENNENSSNSCYKIVYCLRGKNVLQLS